jgi:hypothetical protein
VFVNLGTPSAWKSASPRLPDAVLEDPNASDGEAVGLSSAISKDGTKIVVGAPGFGGVVIPGTTFLFQQPGGAWTGTPPPTQSLTATSGFAVGGQLVTPANSFGNGLAISSDGATIAVGGIATVGSANQGVTYVF